MVSYGNPFDPVVTSSPLINTRQLDRVLGLIGTGQAEGARRILLMLGRDQLGEPSNEVQAALNAITDVNRLEELARHLRRVASWQELLNLNGGA